MYIFSACINFLTITPSQYEVEQPSNQANHLTVSHHVITTQRGYQGDGRHSHVSTPVSAVVVISTGLLYPAFSVLPGPVKWYVMNRSPTIESAYKG